MGNIINAELTAKVDGIELKSEPIIVIKDTTNPLIKLKATSKSYEFGTDVNQSTVMADFLDSVIDNYSVYGEATNAIRVWFENENKAIIDGFEFSTEGDHIVTINVEDSNGNFADSKTLSITINPRKFVSTEETQTTTPSESEDKVIVGGTDAANVVGEPIINTPSTQEQTDKVQVIQVGDTRVNVLYRPETNDYELLDNEGNPLGVVKVPEGKTLEEVLLEDDLIARGAVNINKDELEIQNGTKVNLKTGDDRNMFSIIILGGLIISLIILTSNRINRRNTTKTK